MADFREKWTSIDSARWGTIAANGGSASVSDGELSLTTNGTAGGVAALFLKAAINRTQDQTWTFLINRVWAAGGMNHIITFDDISSDPVAEAFNSAVMRLRVATATDGSTIQIAYDIPAGTRLEWSAGSNTWAAPSQNALGTAMATDDYYKLVFQVDGQGRFVTGGGFRWAIIHQTVFGASYGAAQGERVYQLTDWVPWSSVETISNSLRMTIGWRWNDVANTGTVKFGTIEYLEGIDFAFTNGRAAGGSWQVHESIGPRGKLMLPKSRTPTYAVPLGGGGAWDDTHTRFPSAIRRGDGSHALWYTGDSAGGATGVGVSTRPSDTGSWTKYVSNPIINRDVGTHRDIIFAPHVVEDLSETDPNKRFKGLYIGFSAIDSKRRVFLFYQATPTSAPTLYDNGGGVNNSAVILPGGASSYDESGWGTAVPYWDPISGQWEIWGEAVAADNSSTFVRATANLDLTSITKDPGNPIFSLTTTARQVSVNDINESRVIEVASTSGFIVGAPVIVTPDDVNTNVSPNRVQHILSGPPRLRLWHKMTMGTPTPKPEVRQYDAFEEISVTDVRVEGSELVARGTIYRPYFAAEPYDGYVETTFTLRSANVQPRSWAWDWNETPFLPLAEWDAEASNENPALLIDPTTRTVASSSSTRNRGWVGHLRRRGRLP